MVDAARLRLIFVANGVVNAQVSATVEAFLMRSDRARAASVAAS